jgi:putative transposase
MSRKYKFHKEQGLYFVSFATVYWIDVFIREEYVLQKLHRYQLACR